MFLLSRSIIQDSPDDWASEAACMDKVYINGVCNLAACEITDSNDSFFCSREYPQSGSATIRQQEFIGVNSTETVVFKLMPDWPKLIWQSCNLYRRAWVMQERWLSRRIIHFSQFPVWECSAHLVMEGLPLNEENFAEQLKFDPPFKDQERTWLFSSPNDNHSAYFPCYEKVLLYRWEYIVRGYQKGSLTYKTDKLVAMGGIAKAFSSLLGGEMPYYAGLWGGKYFLKHLNWRVWDKGQPYHPCNDGEYIGRSFFFFFLRYACIYTATTVAAITVYELTCRFIPSAPSWSWASTNTVIYPDALSGIMHNLADVVSCHVVPKGNDVFGQLAGAELILRGTLFTLDALKERNDWTAIARYCFDYEISDNKRGNYPVYFLPLIEAEKPTSLPGEVQPRYFGGLFLRAAEDHTDCEYPKYRRVGGWSLTRDLAGIKILSSEQWDMLENLPPVEAGKGQGELVTII